MTISTFFTDDHRACDAAWTEVERLVDAGDPDGPAAFHRFAAAMERHFRMEEDVLFPAFEAATGMSGGPTAVMRMEHEQMRGLLRQMASAADADPEALLDQGDTLLMLVQQHNVKEEGMLYPMCDVRLGGHEDELLARCAEV